MCCVFVNHRDKSYPYVVNRILTCVDMCATWVHNFSKSVCQNQSYDANSFDARPTRTWTQQSRRKIIFGILRVECVESVQIWLEVWFFSVNKVKIGSFFTKFRRVLASLLTSRRKISTQSVISPTRMLTWRTNGRNTVRVVGLLKKLLSKR